MINCLEDGRYQEAFDTLQQDDSEEARICLYFLLKYVQISIASVNAVASDLSDADIAMAYGFNWAPPSVILSLLKDKVARMAIGVGGTSLQCKELDCRRYFKASY